MAHLTLRDPAWLEAQLARLAAAGVRAAMIAPALVDGKPLSHPALACTDLILNGVLERHPDLRLGIVELSAVWVPLYLMMLDGGGQFVRRLDGRDPKLSLRPSDYFKRQIRVSSFAYELPANLERQLAGADLLMCCRGYPHSEGTAHPLADYAAPGKYGVQPDNAPGLFRGNAEFLLRKT